MLTIKTTQYENLIHGEHPVLIEFWAPWCVYCRRIAPSLEDIANQQEAVLVGQVNIDEEPTLAEREKIEVIPTLLLYQKGKLKGRIVNPESRAKIEAFIKESLGG